MKALDWLKKFPGFLKEVRLEVKKTTFPSRNVVFNSTLVVIIVIFIFGIYLWLVDQVVFSLLNKLFSIFH